MKPKQKHAVIFNEDGTIFSANRKARRNFKRLGIRIDLFPYQPWRVSRVKLLDGKIETTYFVGSDETPLNYEPRVRAKS